MLNLLFSPSGRINSSQFMSGAYVLIAITFLINLLPMVSPALGGLFKLFLILVAYCWVALFIKRYHDGGKSGWMTFIPILIFIVLYFILSSMIPRMFGGEIFTNMETALNEILLEGGGLADLMAVSQEFGAPLAKKIALPSSVIFALASFAIAFLFNSMIKRDPDDNQFGPAS